MTFESLGLLDLSLPQIEKTDKPVLMSREHELILASEVAGQSRGDLVVREDRCLHLLLLHVEDADLVICAACHENRVRCPRHRLHSIWAAKTSLRSYACHRRASSLHRCCLLGLVSLCSPALWIDLPKQNALVRLVDDLRTRDELLQLERVLGHACIPTVCLFHHFIFSTSNHLK